MNATPTNTEHLWECAKSRLHDVYTDLSECATALDYLARHMSDQALNDDLENIGGNADPLDRKRVVRDQYAIGFLMRCMALGISVQADEVSTAWMEYDKTKEETQ